VNTSDDRISDFLRHLEDLRVRGYEGKHDRNERDEVFRAAFTLLTPIATEALQEISAGLLAGSGEVLVSPPETDGSGGLRGGWSLEWPLQRQAKNRFSGGDLLPVTIGAIFPEEWTHAHLAARLHAGIIGLIAWPLQVTSRADAVRQGGIVRAIAEAELHDRIYEADVNWRIIPFGRDIES
jgi:hypothetical protein